MSSIIWWFVAIAILAGIAAVAAVVVKAYLNGETPSQAFFKQRAEPRLSVVEHANVDGKRRLVLIRRDDVEHLIMTGGAVDVVIETSIGESEGVRRSRGIDAFREPESVANPPVFSRSPRTFGQAQSQIENRQSPTSVEEVEAALKR